MLYKLNKWIFKSLIETEYNWAISREVKCLDKYKKYIKRREYLNNIIIEMNDEEVSK